MKKLFLSLVAIAAMVFASSCQQEKMEAELQGGSTVTFTVDIPEIAATRAIGDDVSNINNLVYAVYMTDANDEATAIANLDPSKLLYQVNPEAEGKNTTFVNGATNISLELINDHKYVVLFWAQVSQMWVAGKDFNLTEISYPKQPLAGNDNKYAAFSGVAFVNKVKGSRNESVTLHRPFAQINIATLDPKNYNVEINSTAVTVYGAGSAFNVATQTATSNSDVNYSATAMPANESLEVNNVTYKTLVKNVAGQPDEHHYIASNYVFANSNVEVEYTINTKDHGTIKNKITNVPVKANYRTNIVGNLLTSDIDYNVTLDKTWGDAGKDITVLSDGVVKNINGDYEVSTAAGFAYAINNLFVDENGIANSATFYIKPGTYDFSGYDVTRPNVTSGTLKIYDIEPVVTRATSSTSRVVITGLSGAIIATVNDGATVFFSGITVQNFEGDNASAALVQNNQGKVVLVGCAIVDENGDDDEDATLVGGNAPVELEKDEVSPDGLIYTEEQLAAAFANEDAETISLGADIAVESPLVFPQGRIATLDLRGWKLTIAGDDDKVASTYAICNLGDLTIKDSYALGEVNARGIYNGYDNGNEKTYPEAKLTIESGTFNAKGTNGGAAVFNYGELEIEGGKFTSVGSYSINTQEGGKITVKGGEIAGGMYLSNCEAVFNGGKISGNRSGCHTVYCYNANVTINGGEFYNYNSGNSTIMAAESTEIVYNGGTFGIKDGRVEGNGNTWTSCLLDFQKAAKGTITNGTYNGGIRVQAGTTVDIQGGSFNDCTGSNYHIYGTVTITGGTYTDATAKAFATKYAHKDYKLVGEDVVQKEYTVKIDENGYETLAAAVEAVEDGGTITLVANETFTETNYYDNSGYKDGLGYIGDKSFTIDLGGYTISQDGFLNDYLVWFKNTGTKANTITLKNGTLDAGTTAYCALCTASSHDNQLTVNLENITLINENSNGSTVKIRAGSELNVKAGTKIIGKNSYLGIENWNAVVNIYDGAEIYMNGTSSYNGCLVGVGGNGTVNVYGGYGKGVSGGLIAMTSGGTINAMGGEWIANTDGTYANSNKSVLIAQSDKQYNAGAGNAIVNVTGGSYKGGYNCYGNAVGDAQINIKGGNFNANPANYVVAGYEATENAGIYTVDKPAALKQLEAALANGGNVTLTGDVTLLEPIMVENKVVTLDLNGKTITAPLFSAFEVKVGGELTVKNGKVVAYESTVRAIGGKVIVESGEYTSTGTALDSPSTYRYSLDCREGGELIINGGTFKSNNGLINVGSTVTINGGKFENIVEKSTTRHFAYVSAPLTINDGEFYGKANSSGGGAFFCGAGKDGYIQVNGGKFTSLWTSGAVNGIFEVYFGGTINVTGGMFNTNRGIATFVKENTDEATKAAYPYVAK